MTDFSDNQDNILVAQMETHPMLWASDHEEYNKLESKEIAWSVISKKVGKPVAKCKIRWRNIRDSFHKGLREATKSPGKSRKWASKCSFLLTRRNWNNCDSIMDNDDIQGEQDESNIQWSSSSSLSGALMPEGEPTDVGQVPGSSNSNQSTPNVSMSKKRKITAFKQVHDFPEHVLRDVIKGARQVAEQDDIDLFFQSMAIKLKSLPAPLRLRVQMEVMTVITQAQNEAIMSADASETITSAKLARPPSPPDQWDVA